MSDAVERVLVVPRHVVPERAAWYGLRTSGIDDFLAVVEAHGRYEPRSEMEVDPGFKQIIPYLVLRDGERYFLMRRTRAGGDKHRGTIPIRVGGATTRTSLPDQHPARRPS